MFYGFELLSYSIYTSGLVSSILYVNQRKSSLFKIEKSVLIKPFWDCDAYWLFSKSSIVICGFIFIYERGLYWNSIIFLVRWATFNLTKIWWEKICGEHYIYYNRKITICIKHLSGFKLEHLLHLRIPKVLSINKFSSQLHNLSDNQESAY
jgi:hypothetical protein